MVDWCSINDGTTYEWQRQLEKITQALYDAAVATDLACEFLGKRLDFQWTSGLVFPIFDGSGVPNFVYHATKVWCVGWRLFGFEPVKILLPKKDLTGLITDLLVSIDFAIPGSNQWFYRDTDGVVKKGVDCLTPRSYWFFQNGIPDVKPFAMVGIVILIIKELGLLDLCVNFIKSYYSTRLNRRIKNSLDELKDDLEDLKDDVGILPSDLDVSQIMSAVTENQANLNKLRKQVGVKLLLR